MSDHSFAEMISKMAHELRSPLTSIKGFSATLVSKWDRFSDEQKFQLVETLSIDADRMSRIVNEVLDLARLEADRLELHPQIVYLSQLASKVRTTVAAHPCAERIVVDIPEDLHVLADRERISNVLSHLVENACKFSDEGDVVIAARPIEGAIEVSVSDRGIGIADDVLPSLFTGPAPAGGAATPSGSGLGLYLARRLVEAHGGEIRAASEQGSGSRITFTIPVEAE
jgi:signal transduction histidine kinase